MAINLSSLIRSSEQRKPGRLLVHGVQGVGKTTFAAEAPAPVFIQCEDGLASVDVDAFPLSRTFSDVMQAFESLYQEEHSYKSVIIDSVDWLEPLIYAQTCQDNGWSNIEQPGYGKGYIAAMAYWRQYVEAINALRDDKGMWVLQLAHTDVKKFDDPAADAYDRYVIKLYNKAAALLLEHSDAVIFLNHLISLKTTDQGFGNKKTRAISGGQRVAYCAERPSHIAKNRYGLPDQIIVPGKDWSPVWTAINSAVGI